MSQTGIGEYKAIVQNGLWKQNPGTVQLLGLCPTLAVTSTAVNGLSLGLAIVLTLLGAMREFVGKGTVFSGLDLVFGPEAKAFVLQVIPDYPGFLLAILPPGAFIGLGLLIAGHNWVEQRRAAAVSATPAAAVPSH